MDNQYADNQNPTATETPGGAWDQQAPVSGQPAKPSSGRRRGCCFCCAGLALLPVALVIALVIWLSTGDAPAPADCIAADAPLRIVIQDPTDIVDRMTRDERWREILESGTPGPGTNPGGKGLPPPDQLQGALWMVRQVFGGQVAISVDENGEFVGACRPGILTRGFERLMRAELKKKKKQQDFAYMMIGKTAVFGKDAEVLKPVKARKAEILAAGGKNSPPDDVHAEVRFTDFKPAAHQVPEKDLRGAAFFLDLSSAEKITGLLRLDRDLAGLSGHLQFPAGKHNAPPSMTGRTLKSAALIPKDALGYWVWHAPKGAGRWSPNGRFEEWLVINEKEWALQGNDVAEMKEQMRAQFGKLVEEELTGERAVAIVRQQRAGGKPLMAAASLLVETRNPGVAWPVLAALIETMYKKSTDGQPPKDGGLPVSPYLVDRTYRGKTFMELVYITNPHGSGYQPAFGMAGRFFVATSSKAELKRMIDRASGAAGGSLAGDAELAALLKKSPAPAAAMLLRPSGAGKELAYLLLAIQDHSGDKQEEIGANATNEAETFGKVISNLESLRAEWLPQKDGSLKIEIEGKIVPLVK